MNEINFDVTQGDTFAIQVEYLDDNDSPIELTGYSAYMDVRDKPGGKILCASIDSTDYIDIDEANGVLDISFPPEYTRKFTPRSAYQLQIEDQEGARTTIIKGYFSVFPAVIR